MIGPKMVLGEVARAEQVVAGAVEEMRAVAARLQGQSAASLVAMKAPAGKITSSNYDAHAGAGKALAETLDQLKADLASTRQALLEGSNLAESVAARVDVGGSGAASGAAAAGGGGGYQSGAISSQM